VRTACLRTPDLPLVAEVRARPELAGLPVAVASGPGPRAELIAISPEASRLGVRSPSSVAHARSVCPELRVCVASPALERAARDALLDVAHSFSPRAALAPRASGAYAGEGAVWIDASGVTSLFGSELGFAGAVEARAEKLGLPGRVSIAATRSLALIAARAGAGVIAPGSERDFAAPLAVDVLDPPDVLAEAFTRFGVRTLGDLLALPRRALSRRLGAQVLALIAEVDSRSSAPPLPIADDGPLIEAIDLEYPAVQLDPLVFVIQGLLSRLLERLEMRHLACSELALTLELEGGGRDARRVGVAAPTLDLRGLVRLVAQALETRPPEGPVESTSLATVGVPLPSDQLDLFRPAGPAPAALGPVLAEIEALCGAGQIGAPEVADDPHPGSFGMGRFQPGRAPPPAEPQGTVGHLLALRSLRPPVRAEVRLARGRPEWIRSAVANGEVVSAAGPWRSTGRWWSQEQRFAFDSFDIQTSDGIVARLRLDHIRKTWHIDAVYD
jgi:protein ImuB